MQMIFSNTLAQKSKAFLAVHPTDHNMQCLLFPCYFPIFGHGDHLTTTNQQTLKQLVIWKIYNYMKTE